MTILLRFLVQGCTVTIFETKDEIDFEILGIKSHEQTQAIKNYIIEEGILDEILAGNTQFPQTEAEDILLNKTKIA